MEYIDIVDSENNNINKIEERTIVHRDGLWHREVTAWIINENGEILIQKRVATKKQSPNRWGCTCGHVIAGESVEDGMMREVKEELGFDVLKEDLKLLKITKFSKKYSETQNNNYYEYSFLIKTNKKIEELKPNKEEVSEVRYITIEEFEEKIKNNDGFLAEMLYEHDYNKVVNEILVSIKSQEYSNFSKGEKNFIFERNTSDRDFHQRRRAFLIVNNQIYFMKKGSTQSHWEYCQESFPDISKDEFNKIIRGFYLDGDVVFYKGNFTYDDEVIETSLKYLSKIKDELGAAKMEIYFGTIIDTTKEIWPYDYHYGRIDENDEIIRILQSQNRRK